MNPLSHLFRILKRAFLRLTLAESTDPEDRMDEELEFPLEKSVQLLIEQGHPPDKARRLATLRFGGIIQVKEKIRDEYRFTSLRDGVKDVRIAFRSLRRNPVFALLVILSFGVAVAASVASWSAIQSLLISPLLEDEKRGLVLVWGRNLEKGQSRDVVSGPNYLDLRDGNEVFQSVAAFKSREGALLGAEHPRVLAGIEATPELFEVLRTPFHLGRGFSLPQLRQDPNLVVISHRVWMDHFGGNQGVVGSSLSLLRGTFQVAGVLPADFDFLLPSEVVFPLHEEDLRRRSRTSINYFLLARLREGVAAQSAQQNLDLLMSQIVEQDPRVAGWTLAVEDFRDNLTEYLRVPLLLALGSALLMLAVLVFNTSNLFLARALTRRSETAVRFALGGSRLRVLRQLMTEAIVLGVIGCGFGLAAAHWILFLIGALLPSQVPIPGSASMASLPPLEINGFALLLALCCSAIPLLLVSLAAFSRGSRVDLVSSLKGASEKGNRNRSASPFRSTVISAEVALATVLIAVASLVWGSTSQLVRVDPGFDPGPVLSLYFGELNDRGAAERARYYERVIDSVKRVPGVESVALNDYIPLQQEDDFEGFHFADRAPSRENSFRVEWRSGSVLSIWIL